MSDVSDQIAICLYGRLERHHPVPEAESSRQQDCIKPDISTYIYDISLRIYCAGRDLHKFWLKISV